jgi:hypothetical protein
MEFPIFCSGPFCIELVIANAKAEIVAEFSFDAGVQEAVANLDTATIVAQAGSIFDAITYRGVSAGWFVEDIEDTLAWVSSNKTVIDNVVAIIKEILALVPAPTPTPKPTPAPKPAA